MPTRLNTKCGFTLLELLVVVSVIAMLLAILLPALTAANESGRGSVCSTQLIQMFHGGFAYTEDNNNRVPYFAWMEGRPEGQEWWATQIARGMDQFEPGIYHCLSDPTPQTHIQVYLHNGMAYMADRNPTQSTRVMTLKLTYRGSCDMVEEVASEFDPTEIAYRSRKITLWDRPDKVIELAEGIAYQNDRECFRFSMMGTMADGAGSGPRRPLRERHQHFESWERHFGTSNVLFLDGHVASMTPVGLGTLAKFWEDNLSAGAWRRPD